MLRTLPTLLLLTLILAFGTACGGGISQVIDNPTFSYRPQFTSYSGGVGVDSSPLAGAWNITFSSAIGSGSEVVPAATFRCIAQASSTTRAIGFTTGRETQAAAYLEFSLNGSQIEIKIFQYDPASDEVLEYLARGILDLGTRQVATTTYTVRKVGTGGSQSGGGTWEATATDLSGYTPLNKVRNLRFNLTDKKGQGDMEMAGIIHLTFSGTVISGVAKLDIVNNEGTTVASGSLAITGTRRGGADSPIMDLVFSGSIQGVAFSGSGTFTMVLDGFPLESWEEGDEQSTRVLGSGIIQLSAANDGFAPIRGRDYSGVAGRASWGSPEDE